MVRAVDKFDFRLVMKEASRKRRPIKKHALIKTHVFRKIYMFTPTVITTVKLYPCCAIHLHSLEKRTLPQFPATKLEAE
jgi:hypothetical protein